jgi:drug/metabolite transporter (DMT)-like permease
MAFIVAGGSILTWSPGATTGFSVGSSLVAAACLCWAIDNNLTRHVSDGDPLVIASVKGLIAGTVNLLLAKVFDVDDPAPLTAAMAAMVGFCGYGLSLSLFVLALRNLGTARTGAYFSLAPFFGTALAFGLRHEPVTVQLVAAGTAMAAGVWLHLSERHAHEHTHLPLTHTHRHRHDEHHQHEHPNSLQGEAEHIHEHTHEPLVHSHPHFPDIHHRHSH